MINTTWQSLLVDPTWGPKDPGAGWSNPILWPIPPSVNGLWRKGRGNRIHLSEKYRAWIKRTLQATRGQVLHKWDPELELACLVTVHEGPKGDDWNRKKRDMDNGLKAPIDMARKMGVIQSDTSDTLCDVRIRFGPPANEYSHIQIRFRELPNRHEFEPF